MFFTLTFVFSFLLSFYVSYVQPSGGTSDVYHKQDGNGGYAFGYDINDPWGATNFREESGQFDAWGGGAVIGSYGLMDVDGRKRIVQYSADKNGFVAFIKTNEKGTSDEDAADAYYNGVDKSHGKWLYDFSIKHDKGWGSSWDPWGKSDKGKKKDYGWGASERHEVRVPQKGETGQLYEDPDTNILYKAIDDQHVVPFGRRYQANSVKNTDISKPIAGKQGKSR